MIKKVEHISEYNAYTEFEVARENNAPLTVTVNHPHEAFGRMNPAYVTWASTTDHDLNIAEETGKALILATQLARELNEAL